GTALDMEGKNELVAMRFNLRIPFHTQWLSKTKESPEDFHTIFGTPEISIQKRVKEPKKDVGGWEKFAGWKDFLEKYCQRSDAGDLMNSPIGPLLLEKISDNSGVKDIILKQSKRDEIKTDLANVKKDLDETLSLLESIWKWDLEKKEEEKKENEGPHPSQRKLGSLLESLGFMTGKLGGGGDFEYSFKLAAGLTPWTVLDSVLNELDGFPLFVSGLKSKKDKDARIAISLASQTNPVDTKKHYFGLAGLAYNISLTPVPEKANGDKEPESKGDQLKRPTITLSDDNFTEDESILIEEDEQEEDEGKEETGNKPEEKVEQSKVEALLHLGKWFSGETLDDNWLLRLLPKADTGGKQRVPLPGI